MSQGNAFRTRCPAATLNVSDQTILVFNDPAPNSTLVNFHACMAIIRHQLTALGLWKAAGERTDLFDDDDPNMHPIRPSGAATLGGELVSPSRSGRPATEAFDIPPLVL
ncbi:hypothetical protein HDU90_006439 [Geranomyces variabilis]|nr:hypothetical protein HDU90_006439 [Geranomyces variabilis]